MAHDPLIEYRKKVSKNKGKNFKKSKIIAKARYLRFQTCVCQNVSNEVLFARFKFQAKIPSCSGVCFQGEWQKYNPPSPPIFKGKGPKNIGHSMSIENLILDVNSVTVSCLIRHDRLLQNTKCDKYDYKMRQLLQNATFIINCDAEHWSISSSKIWYLCIAWLLRWFYTRWNFRFALDDF